MASQTTVIFVDDIDGSTEGVERYTFSWLGEDYEIDLAPKSAKTLADVMDIYIDKATPVGKPRAGSGGRSRGSAGSKVSAERSTVIRKWAQGHGLDVSDRGRVSQTIKDAYQQAHQR